MSREVADKHARVIELLHARKLDVLVLQRVSSVAWATGGAATYVNTATTIGPVSLVLTADGARHLVTNNIEGPRLQHEEGIEAGDWQMHTPRWHQPNTVVAALTANFRTGADVPMAGAVDLADDIARLRARLSPVEQERLREATRRCAAAMDAAARALRPGDSELAIAARLAALAQGLGVQAIVNLVATDERIARFRHPLPTTKHLERHAMLVLGGRYRGLTCSLTRLVHFGRLPEDLRRRAQAAAEVDAALLYASRPGRRLGELLEVAQAAYAAHGFPDEWQHHHQGGLVGYEPREALARPGSAEALYAGHGVAWNPSIAGAKSEDTALIVDGLPEILTGIEGWPELKTRPADGVTLGRPATLELT